MANDRAARRRAAQPKKYRWRVRGDVVYVEAPSATEACREYRLRLADAQIAVTAERADDVSAPVDKPEPLIIRLRRAVADMVAQMRVRGYQASAPIGDYVELRVKPIWPESHTYVFTSHSPGSVFLHVDPLPHTTDQIFDTLEDAIAAIPTDEPPPIGMLRSQVIGG
jgi:hypothetical protein